MLSKTFSGGSQRPYCTPKQSQIVAFGIMRAILLSISLSVASLPGSAFNPPFPFDNERNLDRRISIADIYTG